MNRSLLAKVCCMATLAGLLSVSCSKTLEGNQSPAIPGTPAPGDPHTTTTATVSTIAGKLGDHGNAEDGQGANARFWNPTKMIFDSRNNMLYVADGNTIRSIDAQNNVNTYLPLGKLSTYNEIMDLDLAPGAAGGTLYIVTKENDLIKIEPANGQVNVTKLADRIYGGNATGALNSADHFDGASGVTVGRNGEIYFFNSFWNTLRRVILSGAGGTVEPFAGKPLASRSGTAWPFQDGMGETASFGGSVSDISSDANGNIYVADFRNDLVRMVTPAGAVSSLFQYKEGWGIDKDGPVSAAQANRVTQVSATRDGGSVFFTTYGEGGNNLPALRLVRPGKDVATLVGFSNTYGDGQSKNAGLGTIGGIATTPDGKTIYISEPGNKVIRRVVLQ